MSYDPRWRARRSTTTTPELPHHRVLVVDDDVDHRDAISCFFQMQGVDVSTAADGQEALDALAAGPIHCVIVLDLDMAGMDGFEFRRRQLLSLEWAGIPVLILSGHPQLKAVTRTMQAREVWAKPIELMLLLRAVGQHCLGDH